MKKRKPPLGREIESLCKENNIKQKQLASDIGIEPQYLNNVVNGHRQPSLDLLLAIAAHFKCTLVIQFKKKGQQLPAEEQHDVEEYLKPEKNPNDKPPQTFSF